MASRASGWTSRATSTTLWTLCGLLVAAMVLLLGLMVAGTLQYAVTFAAIPLGGSAGTLRELGIGTLLLGTLVVAAVSMLIAVPVSLLAAIHLSELASPRTRRWLKPTVELLASIPPVVHGAIAVALIGFEPFYRNQWLALFAAGVATAWMITPNLCSLGDDALSRIPRSIREGAYALGAGRAAVVSRVLLPYARPALIAALLLSLSRALGETVIARLLFAYTLASGALQSAEEPPAWHPSFTAAYFYLAILAILAFSIHAWARRLDSSGPWRRT